MAMGIDRNAGDLAVKILGTFVSVLYVIILAMPFGWQIKTTQIWTFYIGLWNVESKIDTLLGGGAKSLLRAATSPEYAQKFTAVFEGSGKSIQQFRDQFCNVELLAGGLLNNCGVWQQLLYGSYLAIIAIVIAVVCNLFGVALMFMKPTRCARMSCVALFGVGGFVACGGVAGYFALSLPLKEWLVQIYMSSNSITWGPFCFAAGGIAIVNAVIPAVLISCANMPKKKGRDGYDSDGSGSVSSYSDQDTQYQQTIAGPQQGYGAAGYSDPGYPPQGYVQPGLGYGQPGMQQPGYGY